MKHFALAALAFAATAGLAGPASAQGACDRALMQGIADSWVAALEKGSPFTMNLGEWVDYRENLEPGFMSAFFDAPHKVDWHLSLLDPTGCKAAVEVVILDPARPLVLATQLTNGFFGVGPIDNVVPVAGDAAFAPQASLDRIKPEDWGVIPEAQRMDRAALLAAANAWLDKAGSTERVYVVDESLGAVNVLSKFGPAKRPASHTFRIEGGQVVRVHAVANCGTVANCAAAPAG